MMDSSSTAHLALSLPDGVRVRPLVLPDRADGPGSADLQALAPVRNEIYRAVTGRSEDDRTPAELLPILRSTADTRKLLWLVEKDGALVGRVGLFLPQEEGAVSATMNLDLLPRVWGQGIGSAVYPLIEQQAREHGRTAIELWAEQPASAGPRIAAPTGYGSVPDDRIAGFLRGRGFRLEQVDRISMLALDEDARARLGRLLADARAHAEEYRLVRWTFPTPPERIDGYAWMKSRMSTDAPSAGLSPLEEVWDAARVREFERSHLDGGRHVVVTAAEHTGTGELSAFTELSIGPDRTASTHQDDTLVLAAHRGHRLGLIVKCASLLGWMDEIPSSPRAITYNAEENRPMLDINETLGFAPVSYEGAWRKDLT
ncbi:GNAT superfamily N-acetyltransferase [Microbacterium resistens]|uniref:GNAT superfamily N-acetyltransferase n=1 Tax=Microbacterium resistens TaxID=156977 RepID=A0ABU1S8P1_9MICO|nr:GNAT family N-acetyltransferase [Microbacterium resistens]MDR6865969.1 GNAT superfamily N-acetyltransferase [Microbacterium resistens]